MASDQGVSIFVSHSSKDNDFGVQLVKDLRKMLGDEKAVWYDARGGLNPGDRWFKKIEDELSARNIFILVLSPNAMNSDWVRREFDIALIEKKFIVPVLFQECQLWPYLRTIQYVSFLPPKTYKTALAELIVVMGLSSDVVPEEYDLTAARELSKNVLNINVEPEKYGRNAARGIYDLVQSWPEGYDLAMAKGEGRIDSGASLLAIWDEKQAIVFDKRFQQLRQELWDEQIESEIVLQMEEAKRAIQPLIDAESTSVVFAPYNAAPDTCDVFLQEGVARVRYKDTENLGVTTNCVRSEVAAGSNMFARMFYKPKAQEAYALSLLEIDMQSQAQLINRFAIAEAIVGMGAVYLASYAIDRSINPREHHMARALLTNLPHIQRAISSQYQKLLENFTS